MPELLVSILMPLFSEWFVVNWIWKEKKERTDPAEHSTFMFTEKKNAFCEIAVLSRSLWATDIFFDSYGI